MNTQVVLITGALIGIGRATALAFANEGAQVAVSGRHDEEGQKLVGEIRKRGWPMKSSPVERRSE
jgi:NAD(P)-dependent dehydrogenase (short-subunit alcohol dehydrogenase family)